MADDVLLRFLDADLLPVGGDDQKFNNIQAAAADLASELSKSPGLATPFALIAADAEAPMDDPVVVQALAALKARWTTYRTTFASTPMGVVRAMLLEALVTASKSDDRIGVAFVTAARNLLPFSAVGPEQPIWADAVADTERRLDARAEAEWSTPDTVALPPFTPEALEIGAPSVKTSTVNRDALRDKILASAGPHSYDADGSTIETQGNPYWPNNDPQNWNKEFGVRLSSAISGVIDAVSQKTTVELPDLSVVLKGLSEQIALYVSDGIQTAATAASGLDRRTRLLWWKEALYSPSARLRYRELSPTTAAALMGYDLHVQTPTFTPGSVTAFLCEAVESLPQVEIETRYAISDLVTDLKSALAAAPLRETLGLLLPSQSRRPVLALVVHPEVEAASPDAFRTATGVPAETQITLPEWAVWVFRELQAARAATEGGAAKKRGRKS